MTPEFEREKLIEAGIAQRAVEILQRTAAYKNISLDDCNFEIVRWSPPYLRVTIWGRRYNPAVFFIKREKGFGNVNDRPLTHAQHQVVWEILHQRL